jgi:hypothetical protein
MLTNTQREMLEEIDENQFIKVKYYQGQDKTKIEFLEKQGLIVPMYHLTDKGKEALRLAKERSIG